jgi:hypothetical protein
VYWEQSKILLRHTGWSFGAWVLALLVLPPFLHRAPWVFMLIGLVFQCNWIWQCRRLARHVRQHKGLLCVKCEYDLRGMEDGSRCPECGAVFSREHTLRFWEPVLRRAPIDKLFPSRDPE